MMTDLISQYITKKELDIIKPIRKDGLITVSDLRSVHYALRYSDTPPGSDAVNHFGYTSMPDADSKTDWNIFSQRNSGKTYYLVRKAIELLTTEVGIRIVWIGAYNAHIDRPQSIFREFCETDDSTLSMVRNRVYYSTNNSELIFTTTGHILQSQMYLHDKSGEKVVLIIDEPYHIRYVDFEEAALVLLGGSTTPFRLISAGTRGPDREGLDSVILHSPNLYKATIRVPQPTLTMHYTARPTI